MSEKLLNAIEEEVLEEFEHVKKIDVGSAEFKIATDGVAKLLEKRAEIIKLEQDRVEKDRQYLLDADLKNRELEEKIAAREADVEIKLAQLEEQRVSREEDQASRKTQTKHERWKMVAEIGKEVSLKAVEILITCLWLKRIMRFEETGSIVNQHSKKIVDNKVIRKL